MFFCVFDMHGVSNDWVLSCAKENLISIQIGPILISIRNLQEALNTCSQPSFISLVLCLLFSITCSSDIVHSPSDSDFPDFQPVAVLHIKLEL